MSKLSLSGKIPSATPITLSTHQTMLVEKFIAERGTLTLASIDAVIQSAQQRAQILYEKIQSRAAAKGIDIQVINDCKRIPEEKKTALQQHLASLDIDAHAYDNAKVDQYLAEELTEVQRQLSEWGQIRQIFIDIYPESKTSPRLSRTELEKSPTRFSLAKSLSQPALSSPRLTPRSIKLKKENSNE